MKKKSTYITHSPGCEESSAGILYKDGKAIAVMTVDGFAPNGVCPFSIAELKKMFPSLKFA